MGKKFKIKLLNQKGYLIVSEKQANAILTGDLINAKKLGITIDEYMSCKSYKWPIK